MQKLFESVELDQEAAAYIARGLRALAACDGLKASELALVEGFERDIGIEATAGEDFELDGGGPLSSTELREVFLRSLQLMALVSGRVTEKEASWVNEAARGLGIDPDRQAELDRETRMFLLGSLEGIQVFKEQAVSVGRSLGLSDEDIEAALTE